MRRVQFIMGMPITIEINRAEHGAVFDKAFNKFRDIDEQFSTYKKNSEVSRFARGELKENQLSGDLAEVIKKCRAAERQTGGYFSAWYSGRFDPSGYVKGWAIAKAAKLIKEAGYGTYCISAGGDILARSAGEKIWKIGIQDPHDPGKLLNLLSNFDSSAQKPFHNRSRADGRLPKPRNELSHFRSRPARLRLGGDKLFNQLLGAKTSNVLKISSGAIATSGSYERGSHIINPKTGKPATELVSVSVVGRDIITADVLATALFAAGEKGLPLVEDKTGYEALALGPEGRVFITSGMPKKLSAVTYHP